MKWLLFSALLFCACPSPPTTLPLFETTPAPLRWYDRAGRVRFQLPEDWEIEEQPTDDPATTVYGGRSSDNACFLLLVSVEGGTILSDEALLTLAQEKFFDGPRPSQVEARRLNNLEGRRAELVGTLGGEPVRALVFATRWSGAAYLLLVGSREVVAAKNRPQLEQILGSFTGT